MLASLTTAIAALSLAALALAAPCTPETPIQNYRVQWYNRAEQWNTTWQVYRGYPDKNMPNGALVYTLCVSVSVALAGAVATRRN